MLTSTKQLHIENSDGSHSQRISKVSINDKVNEEEDYSRMRKIIMRNKHLVSVEVDENELKQKEKSVKKKEIVSYIANRDTLFIPHPERIVRPVDIKSNLIEDEKKKPVADIGMQSDVINYQNPEKPFIPQKIGRDVGVQIEDGDLFNFDRDVETLLTVLCGKILEQSELELSEEAEMKNLKDTKNSYLRKLKAYKEEVKKLEEAEISRKKENDNIKKLKRIEKISKIDTQQKLTSRVFAKGFLKNFYLNTIEDLITRKAFLDYSSAIVKDRINDFNLKQTELVIEKDKIVENSLNQITNEMDENKLKAHSERLNQHKKMIQKRKEEAERRRIEEEERLRIEEEARKERKRLRDIRKLRASIKKLVFEAGPSKGSYFAEEISEIDNYEQEGPYVGIYGGLIGMFMISLSILKKNFFQQDNNYTQEMIIEILTNYINECEFFNVYFDASIEDTLKDILKIENLEINNLKGNTDLGAEEWTKIGDFLSDINLNFDYLLKFLPKQKDSTINLNFYSLIIKGLCTMVEKGICINKINFIFKNPSDIMKKEPEEIIKNYQAFCKYTMNEDWNVILENVDFIKDNKKKSVKVPELEGDFKIARNFAKTPEHNILIYDKIGEFVIRNKILESCIRAIHHEIETKPIFKGFNEFYEEIVNTEFFENSLQTFVYKPAEFQIELN